MTEGTAGGGTLDGAGEQVEVRDNPDAGHWEAVIGTEVVGFAVYEREGDVVTFVHTEVDPRFGGRGIGSTIVRSSLDDARHHGLKVKPVCPLYARFVQEHEEYQDLVV